MADPLYLILFSLFEICLLVQLYYTLVIHSRLASYKTTAEVHESTVNQDPVSVIICARNEAENLSTNLPLFLGQDYPNFEIIVVNDRSTDTTADVLLGLSKNKNLKIVTITEQLRFKQGKKFAVSLGIKAAKNEQLLFTDADCRPQGTSWITNMQKKLAGKEIVLGYSPYVRYPGFLNKLIRFETFFTALNYLSFALSGRPYMGVGRNMGYKKALFFKSKGFASHMHILSGDDDLFVNQNARENNTAIEISPESVIWSEPERSYSRYFNQKIRHMGAGKEYKSADKKMLTFQALSGIFFYILLVALICVNAQWWFIAATFGVKTLVQLYVYRTVFKKLQYPDLWLWFPIFDIICYIYLAILTVAGLFKKKVQWK